MLPSSRLKGGPTQDVLAEAFLSAPLPTLPRCHHIFQWEDINVNAAKASFNQFVKHYHNVATALDAGFGPKTTLSPSVWVKSIADLTTRILYRVAAMRTSFSGSVLDKCSPFRPKDQPSIIKIQENLDHLSKVFSLSSEPPSLMCDHCLHRTDQGRAWNGLMEADYTAILMATDRSWVAVLDQILTHFSTDIHKEVSTWALDEGTHQHNTLRLRVNEESENFYAAISLKARETQEAQAKADNENYYAKHLAELKKDADA